ncbi:MAG: M28 family peptidase [Dehalococcoidia bacterium]|nr:M28 family peptidase [Dehalococcoidia bacterium]
MRIARIIALFSVVVLLASCQQMPLVGTSAALSAVPPSATPTAAESDVGKQALEYIRVLSVDIGPRDTASGAEERAASYLEQELKAAGFQVGRQQFPVPVFDAQVSQTAPQQHAIDAEPLRFSMTGEVTAPLLFGGLGSPDELSNAGMAGKVALLERGQITFQDKVVNAARAGAPAVVVFNNAPGPIRGSLTATGSTIPIAGITREEGQALRDALSRGTGSLSVTVRRSQMNSQNVIAEIPGTGAGTVILGGHYDTVPVTGGAVDNASGTAVLLTLAHKLAGKQFPFTVQIIAFGAEELGLVGSQAYVSDVVRQAKSQVIAMVNLM